MAKKNENTSMPTDDKKDSDLIENDSKIEILDDNKKDIAVSPKTDIANKKRKLSKKNKILIITCAAIFLFICIIFGIITCVNKLNSNVYKNVYLFNENFSGKSSEEVIQTITNISNDLNSSEKIDIYQDGENIYTIKAEDLDFKFDIDKTVQNVMNFGRDSNIFVNNFNILKALFSKKVIEPAYSYDINSLDNIMKNVDLTIKDRYNDASYSLDEKEAKIVIVNGKTGNSVNYDEEKNNIVKAFESRNQNTYDLNTIKRTPQSLDADKVYSEVKRDAKDAYVDKTVNPNKYVAEVVGFDFDVNKLKELLDLPENKEEGKTIEFKVTKIEPKVKLVDISADMCNEKLAGYTTYFPAGSYARSNNLKIALSYMNGVVILPGETYSYNNNIGETTASKGYQAAATFKGGTTVDEMGGGICQTVSTLYNTVLMANLEIVERHQHGLPVGYVPPSRDATVYSPVLDFKFKNNRETPIKIVTSFSYSGSLNVSIYGTKQNNDPEVILSQKTTGTISYTTRYEYDSSIPYGKQVVATAGVNGYTSESYITKKLNGQVISSGLLSRDKYNAQQQVIKVGTGGS